MRANKGKRRHPRSLSRPHSVPMADKSRIAELQGLRYFIFSFLDANSHSHICAFATQQPASPPAMPTSASHGSAPWRPASSATRCRSATA